MNKRNKFDKNIVEFYKDIKLIKDKYNIEEIISVTEIGSFTDLDCKRTIELLLIALRLTIYNLVKSNVIKIDEVSNFLIKQFEYIEDNIDKVINID